LGIVDPYPYNFAGYPTFKTGPASSGTPQTVSKGGAPASGSSVFQRAMIAYVEGRYKDALPLLETAVPETSGPDAPFYLGVCRLLRGKPQEALAPLQDALRSGNTRYSQAAHFYLAKAYIQTRDLAAAQRELEAATAQAGRLSEESRKLLERVRDLRSKMQ